MPVQLEDCPQIRTEQVQVRPHTLRETLRQEEGIIFNQMEQNWAGDKQKVRDVHHQPLR